MVDGIKPRLNTDKPGAVAPSQQKSSNSNTPQQGAGDIDELKAARAASARPVKKPSLLKRAANAALGRKPKDPEAQKKKQASAAKIAVANATKTPHDPDQSASQISSLQDPGKDASVEGKQSLSTPRPKNEPLPARIGGNQDGLQNGRIGQSEQMPTNLPSRGAPGGAVQGNRAMSQPAVAGGQMAAGTSGQGTSSQGSPNLSDTKKVELANNLSIARNDDAKKKSEGGDVVSEGADQVTGGGTMRAVGKQVGGTVGAEIQKAYDGPVRSLVTTTALGCCVSTCGSGCVAIFLLMVLAAILYGSIDSFPGGQYILQAALWFHNLF